MGFRKSIFFVCLLIGLSFALVSLSEASVGTWEYNFADVQGDEWENDWEVIAGSFKVEDGALIQEEASANDNNAFRCLADTDWEITDGTIEAKVKHMGAGLNDALIFYRMSDTDNGYASRLQLDSYITVGGIAAGAHSHIKYVSTPVVAEQWYIVKIVLEGDSITVFVDDEEFFTAEDSSSSKGRVGFGMSRCIGGAALEWIRVTGEGVTPTAVAPAGKLATTWGEVRIAY